MYVGPWGQLDTVGGLKRKLKLKHFIYLNMTLKKLNII